MAKFVDVKIPGVGAARFARLQPWQLHRLQFELMFAGVTSVDDFDSRRCARLVQIVAVPTDSAVLLFPGGVGLELLQSRCNDQELRDLAAVAVTHNEVFGNEKDIVAVDRGATDNNRS